MQDLIEAGVHFGHKKHRWNPKMAPYIYGVRNNVHIIDLQQTVPLLQQALHVVRDVAANNGRILFVGTKRQACDIVAEAAVRCGQYYVNQRWLGGMLTNWQTIQNSIKKLRSLEAQAERTNLNLTKKERLNMERQRQKLEKSLGGIKDMSGQPNLLFVIDTNREELAIAEAKRLGIPVIAILDSNSSPDDVTYPIPGNDDATKAIRLYCNLIAEAALDGIQASLARSGQDIGEMSNPDISDGKATSESAGDSASDDENKEESKSEEVAVVVKKTAKKKLSTAEESTKASTKANDIKEDTESAADSDGDTSTSDGDKKAASSSSAKSDATKKAAAKKASSKKAKPKSDKTDKTSATEATKAEAIPSDDGELNSEGEKEGAETAKKAKAS